MIIGGGNSGAHCFRVDMEFFGVKSVDLVVVGSLVLGALVILGGFIIGRRTGSARTKHAPKYTKAHVESQNSEPVTSSGNNQTATTGGGKRAKNKKRREAQQEFTHSWMVGALKGHTGPVLDMNFSSDGKFLASCAEDCGLVPEDLEEGAASSAPPGPSEMATSSSTASSSSMDRAAPKEGDRAILSRRQRKNRTRASREQRRDREDDPEDDNNVTPPPRHRHHHRLQQQHERRYLTESPTRSSDSGTSSNRPKNSRQQLTIKNRKSSESACKSDSKSVNQSSKTSAVGNKKLHNVMAKCSHHRSQLKHLTDAGLAALLRRYVLSGAELAHFGYPVQCNFYPGYTVILNHHSTGRRIYNRNQQQHHLDVNAQEFIPSTNLNCYNAESEADSGNGSGSSVENSDLEPESLSDSDKSSDIVESSSSASSSSDYTENTRRDSRSTPESWTPERSLEYVVERTCVRCNKSFYINRTTGHYITEERCIYHWGKLRNTSIGSVWECCGGREHSRGCATAKVHVWTGLNEGFNGPFTGYTRTPPPNVDQPDGNYGVYALDCEMCFTRHGLELAKVTVVGLDGNVVYDTFVKPDDDVLDYNTRFSGITAKALSRATKTLRDVQNDLMSFINSETILIGHGLENDLRALKILHAVVIDTCVAFPHHLGFPYRSSLKLLAKRLLKREIQVSKHDSVEDAKSAVDLMLRRVELDLWRT